MAIGELVSSSENPRSTGVVRCPGTCASLRTALKRSIPIGYVVVLILVLISNASLADVVSAVPQACDEWADLSPKKKFEVCVRDSVAASTRPREEVTALCLDASGYTPGVDEEGVEFWRSFGTVPVYSGEGGFRGLRISRIASGSLLKQVGILQDDVVIEVNGIPLNRPVIAVELLRQLRWMNRASVRVRRGDRVLVLDYRSE